MPAARPTRPGAVPAASRALALLVGAALALACTTSFDADQLRARADAATDMAADLGRDGPAPDAPDAPSSTCGGAQQPCCAEGVAPTPCDPGLVCSGARCVPCPAPLFECGGRCVDVRSSPLHCGRCDSPCPDGQTCRESACALECAPGLNVCGGRCVQLLSNASHCGSCGVACAFPHARSRCAAGECAAGACDDGWGDCDGDPANGCETSLDEPTNCGACRRACALAGAAARCVARACEVASCNANSGDCDGDPANGCETNLLTSTQHCGACGNGCPPPDGGMAVCRAGACSASMVACTAPRADCNGVASDGCEVDTAADVANCGACGNRCALTNATAACRGAACAVLECAGAFRDCDLAASNGCETDTAASVAHCGACGAACAPPHATPACASGACRVGACDEGWADCDGAAANGCEVALSADPANCGACGVACALANAAAACAGGRCAVRACVGAFADCDGNPANGCEASVASDAANCSACGGVCSFANASSACRAGSCAVGACNAGFADCDATPSNGCEANLASDPAHCGACATACPAPNGSAACVAGRCALGACSGPYADCDGNPANGCEVDASSDARNCGGCGVACGAGQVCASGGCRATCPAGQTLCGASCVDLQASALACGRCDRACDPAPNASATCRAGVCGIACAPGYQDCDASAANGCEVNAAGDPRNCGRCGAACPAVAGGTTYCAAGACAVACAGGLSNCDGSLANGCERNTATDPANCGGCGARCAPANADPACASGVCGHGPCRSNYADCDGAAANGCETNLRTSTSHCGACGVACNPSNATAACSSSGGSAASCSYASCNAGFGNCDNNAPNGCESALNTVTNCGACGIRCVGSNTGHTVATCESSRCVARCATGYANCDGLAFNGCEANLQGAFFNCGACGTACAFGQLCMSGACR